MAGALAGTAMPTARDVLARPTNQAATSFEIDVTHSLV
jgi:hypothetical protein